jgi:hypothetical protein
LDEDVVLLHGVICARLEQGVQPKFEKKQESRRSQKKVGFFFK